MSSQGARQQSTCACELPQQGEYMHSWQLGEEAPGGGAWRARARTGSPDASGEAFEVASVDRRAVDRRAVSRCRQGGAEQATVPDAPQRSSLIGAWPALPSAARLRVEPTGTQQVAGKCSKHNASALSEQQRRGGGSRQSAAR
jgi:hypothetical protein